MNTFINVTLLVSAAYLILGLALIMNTENLRSAIMFKVIPFILGAALLYVAAYQNGMVGAPAAPGAESISMTSGSGIPNGRPQRVPCVGRLTAERSPDCMLAIATRRVPSNISLAANIPMSERIAGIWA